MNSNEIMQDVIGEITITISGPTGSGKTLIAMELEKHIKSVLPNHTVFSNTQYVHETKEDLDILMVRRKPPQN